MSALKTFLRFILARRSFFFTRSDLQLWLSPTCKEASGLPVGLKRCLGFCPK